MALSPKENQSFLFILLHHCCRFWSFSPPYPLLLSYGFSYWLSSSDIKLLQTTPKADIVVAQDGTGNYKTISEGVAAAAAAKLSGKGGVVIHVKAGVYKESVDIKRSIKNSMIIGDGMGSTIVIGNNNAQDGSIAFRSDTFGNEEEILVTGMKLLRKPIMVN
ncbi:Pectinesterase, catalytic [Sesbania bispinosa]|nr:Pectinesterase, catalytic [Sesbania bispinosa]